MIISYEVIFEICNMSRIKRNNNNERIRIPPEKYDVIELFEKRLGHLYNILKESKSEEDIREIERRIEKKKESIQKIQSIDQWIPFCEKIYNCEYSWPGVDEPSRQESDGE